MEYEVNGAVIGADEEGYITDIGQWSPELASVIAKAENIDMDDDHWEVVRVLTKAINKSLGPEKGNSKYLYELFPYGPAKQACKIAGLPKPTGCI
jgi:sulfur relay (sulfurtransferase) DsrC/TusE family protein